MYSIICPNPNCNYKGSPMKRAKGSCLVFVLLLLLCFPIALIYAILTSGYVYACPRCQMGIRNW